MCGSETWILLDGRSLLQALEGGLEALAYSCTQCGFIRYIERTRPNSVEVATPFFFGAPAA